MSTRTFAITMGVCLATSAGLLAISALTGSAAVGIAGAAVLLVLALAQWWWMS